MAERVTPKSLQLRIHRGSVVDDGVVDEIVVAVRVGPQVIFGPRHPIPPPAPTTPSNKGSRLSDMTVAMKAAAAAITRDRAIR
ncbi:hypothetical protein [Mycobacterium camsae]|uniref:hypothetical protein n=1 Tax=Mycobacterium gordonae TaxID=1778 RepID=UPI00197DA700|nr:hypothetical protein [Mycobacterium gordonae]